MEASTRVSLSGALTASHIFYTPLLIEVGILGNVLTVVVLKRTKLRQHSTCQYLAALAIVDSVFLLMQAPPWLDMVGATNVFARAGFCEVFVYASYVSCCASAWLVAAFTVERWVAVRFPLKRQVLSTTRRARLIVAAVVASALAANVPVLRIAAAVDGRCGIDPSSMTAAAVFNVYDTVFSFTLPLLIIMVLNGKIGFSVIGNNRIRRALIRAHGPGRVTEPPPYVVTQQKITTMLLVVSSTFVLFNLPAYIIRIIAYAYDMKAGEQDGFWQSAQLIAFLVFNTNFAINFIVYCLCSQHFRNAIMKTLRSCRTRDPQPDLERGIDSPHRASIIAATALGNLAAGPSSANSSLSPDCFGAETNHPNLETQLFELRCAYANSRRSSDTPPSEEGENFYEVDLPPRDPPLKLDCFGAETNHPNLETQLFELRCAYANSRRSSDTPPSEEGENFYEVDLPPRDPPLKLDCFGAETNHPNLETQLFELRCAYANSRRSSDTPPSEEGENFYEVDLPPRDPPLKLERERPVFPAFKKLWPPP